MKKAIALIAALYLCAGGITAQTSKTGDQLLEKAPEVIVPVKNFMDFENAEDAQLELKDNFLVPDDPDAQLNFSIGGLSDSSVAVASVTGTLLEIDYIAEGQTTVILEIRHNELSVTDTFAVGVWPVVNENAIVSDIDDIELDTESYWNGDDLSGGFQSGLVWFPNSYNPDWAAWNGWACSNVSDNTTPGFANQYSAITGEGMPGETSNYAISYASPHSTVRFTDSVPHEIDGFFVTNATYTALAMKYGDAFSKKFGGASGEDPDWLKLTIRGYYKGATSGDIDFMLADYRSADPIDDYIIETWQWVDLTDLGMVDSIMFFMESTDHGDWGMNTPAYFCLDELSVKNAVGIESPVTSGIRVYPNPFVNGMFITSGEATTIRVTLYNMQGSKVLIRENVQPGSFIDLFDIPAGPYMMKIEQGTALNMQMVFKQH